MHMNLSSLKAVVDGMEHLFLCPANATTLQVKDALFQFMKYVGNFEDQAKAQQEAQSSQAAAQAEVKEEQSKVEPMDPAEPPKE